jgi:ATP-binding cassette subfamily B (MDR/TAP) protein 1
MLASGPVIAVLGSVAAALNDLFTKRTNNVTAKATSIVNEVSGSMRTVRSMAGEQKEQDRFRLNMRRIIYISIPKSILLALLVGIIIGTAWAASVITFWVGGKLIKKDKVTVGALLEVLGMVTLGVVGASQAMTIIPEFAKASAAGKSLLKVISRKPSIPIKGGKKPERLIGNIEFKNIEFRYPSRQNVQVLKDFSLSVTSGQNVALVGPSGSGKSTIVGLLERFYEPESGQVLIDGVDIKDIDPQWLHRHIGIVTQEPTLFATSIKNNITYAVSQYGPVSDEEIIKAAKDANAHDFIINLPNGYNTMLGERGVSLSGGQKQRVAIARAMIQNPSVLLLDEATSALDTESESLVQDALSRLMEGRTSIVIAHRLSTVQNSDVIVVMAQGKIVEMGKHSDLVTIPNGVYAKLAAKQMKFGHKQQQTTEEKTI